MPKANDLHHLAIATADIKTQIEFFSDVLGMELVALYWMHGVDGCFHGFMKLHDRASIAFVQTPDNHKIPPEIGVTHAGNPGGSCEAGKGGAIPQPPYDPAKPNPTMPDHMRAILSWPDEQVTATLSQPEPPVKLAATG